MKVADLRIQTSAPTAPSAGVVALYANASGVPVTINSAGVVTAIAGQVLTTYANSAVVTGGASYLGTGTYFGPTVGASAVATGLSAPSTWFQVSVSGTNYAIPAYALR